MLTTRNIIIGSVTLVIVGLIIAVMAGVFRTEGKLYSVSQLKDRGGSDTPVKVRGNVVPGSITWDGTKWVLQFTLSEGTVTLPVSYSGTWRHETQLGGEVIVDGKMQDNGTFLGNSFDRRHSPYCQTCHGS